MKIGLILFLIYKYYEWYYQFYNRLYFEPIFYIFEKQNEPINTHVYAIDFDNTIAYTSYPKILKAVPYAFEVLRILSKDPHSILILWTCRENEYLKQALDYCELNGVKFDYINENCKRNLDLYVTDCRKISADVYIDDHSYQGQEGVEKLWKDWYGWLKDNGF